MSPWKIAWRSIEQRALSSTLTGISMALGVMLVVAVLVAHGVINQSFLNNSNLGYNLVVGAKGGRLDLVLNSVYYLSRPVENIPYTYYQQFTDGEFSGVVEHAIPICMGDVYGEFRVIGTTPGFFDDLEYGGKKYEFAQGHNFTADDYYGAVIGATVARETGLKVGDEFQPSHGAAPDAHVHDPFKIVGVLKPTGTPNDRGLFINMEGFYLIPEHAKPTDDEPIGGVPAAKPHDDHHDHADHDHAAEHSHDAKEHADHAHEHDADGKTEHPHEHPGEAADHDHADPDHEKAAGKHDHEHDEAHEHAHADHDHAAEAEMPADGEAAGHGDADHDHADHGHEHGEHAHEEHGHEEHAHDEHRHSHAHHEHGAHDHDHAHEPLPLEKREVTAVLVALKSIGGAPPELFAPEVVKKVNKGPVAQAVLPIREMSVLFTNFVDPLQIILLTLTVLIVIVSGIGILVSIYNSMSERQHEIAVVRALGAGRNTVMFLVLLESILLSLIGGAAGWLVGHGLIALASPWIATQTGVSIGFLQFVGLELVIIPALVALAAIVGFLPGLAAYRTDVAKALSATP